MTKQRIPLVISSFILLYGVVWRVAWSGEADPPGLQLRGGEWVLSGVLEDGSEPATGLDQRFPHLVSLAGNPTTPARAELGRLLFFDPILSGADDISCAHCHHPDFGFSDGLPRSRGLGAHGAGAERRGGIELARSAPSLWNALFNHRQFWDGRARTLEEQARGPITDAKEMAEDPERLVRELSGIPEYRERFLTAFGASDSEPIRFEWVLMALAAFERTLVSVNSRFDRYARGASGALSAEEVEGLKLFLSTRTRCSECHGLPAFANRDFKVIGVPDPRDGPADAPHPAAEPGRGGGPNGAFKVPTLRNVALTAPYMHNGVFKTLDEVIDFYARGGGRGLGLEVPLQDDKIRPFKLEPQEKSRLIAFLRALTDVSALPPIPERAPSGLPVVRSIKSPAGRPPIDEIEAAAGERRSGSRQVIEVGPEESLQAAVDRAGRGGTVRLKPGIHHQSALIIHHDFTLEGIEADGRSPCLDGRGILRDAVIALGRRLTAKNFSVKNYLGNGIVAQRGWEVRFEGLQIENPGLYGLYPVECQGVLVERCRVQGASDAGIYVGQSRNIRVRGNEAFANVAGIEIENSSFAVVEDNDVHDNTGGILVVLLPFNASKTGSDCIVRNNRVYRNNAPNFAEAGAIVASVLQGSGILILGADHTEVHDNAIADNDSFGVSISGTQRLFPPATPFDIDPNPDGNRVAGNLLRRNGRRPDPRLASKFQIPGADLLWDGSGRGNGWLAPDASAFPSPLPAPLDNRLSEEERLEGWKLLFDGRSLGGWMRSDGLPSRRGVDQDAINPHGCGHYMLVHEEPVENFILSLEFKISAGCNSGVFFRTWPLTPRPNLDVGYNGIEMAIDDTAEAGYHDTGALYDLAPPRRNAMKPAGFWNHALIRCQGSRISIDLNGDRVTEVDLAAWTEPGLRPDGSRHKFTDIAYRDHPRRGYIGLQDHGADCWFKNLKIKLLPDGD